MSLRVMFAEIQYLAGRVACRLFGWSPAFRHLGLACRGREACAEKIRRNRK